MNPKPIIHYSPLTGWMGDPNGLVYHNGTYHMFYQYEPTSSIWTPNMHWGHAISKDLIHWESKGIKIYPDKNGAIWSGSAVIDKNNTVGYGDNTMICVYTSSGDKLTQSMAFSKDLVNFEKYVNNPILQNIADNNRDPKIFWYEDTKEWIMVLYMFNGYGIFKSTDMKQWQMTQIVEIDTKDCPDMFQLKHKNTTKWILMGTEGKYIVGDFDGNSFTPVTDVLRFAFGNTYASQVWNDGQMDSKYMIFRLGDMTEGSSDISQMSLTMELRLDKCDNEYYLTCEPIKKYDEIICYSVKEIYDQYVSYEEIDINAYVFAITMVIGGTCRNAIIGTANGNIEYDPRRKEVKYKDIYTKIDTDPNDNVKLKIVFDVNSVEIYNDNKIYIGCATNGKINNKISLENIDIREFVVRKM